MGVSFFMDQNFIQMALQKMRGQGQGAAPSSPSMDPMQGMPQMPGMPGQNPFQLNQGLETQAAGQNSPLDPIMQQIMQKFGLLNMLRNRSNQQMVDPGMPG